MNTLTVALCLLAVWRVTHLLRAEDGPWQLIVRLRRLAGGGFWGQLLDCFYCLSLWVAAPFALLIGSGWRQWLLLWLGLSGGAILLERVTTREASFVEDPDLETSNGMLREEPTDGRLGNEADQTE